MTADPRGLMSYDELADEYGHEVTKAYLTFKNCELGDLVDAIKSHPAVLKPGEWWACSRSETRIDYDAKVELSCRGCLVAYFAWLVTNDPRYQPAHARINEDGRTTAVVVPSRETWDAMRAVAAVDYGIVDLPLWPEPQQGDPE